MAFSVRPFSRKLRLASCELKRSSANSHGIPQASEMAFAAARMRAACGPSSPAKVMGSPPKQKLRLPILKQTLKRLRMREHVSRGQNRHRRRHPLPRVAHRNPHARLADIQRHDSHDESLPRRKRASPIHGEAVGKDPSPWLKAPLAEPAQPAADAPRVPRRGVRREIPHEPKRPVDVSRELRTARAPRPSARHPAGNPTAAVRAQPEERRRCPRRPCRRPAPWRPFRRRRP